LPPQSRWVLSSIPSSPFHRHIDPRGVLARPLLVSLELDLCSLAPAERVSTQLGLRDRRHRRGGDQSQRAQAFRLELERRPGCHASVTPGRMARTARPCLLRAPRTARPGPSRSCRFPPRLCQPTPAPPDRSRRSSRSSRVATPLNQAQPSATKGGVIKRKTPVPILTGLNDLLT